MESVRTIFLLCLVHNPRWSRLACSSGTVTCHYSDLGLRTDANCSRLFDLSGAARESNPRHTSGEAEARSNRVVERQAASAAHRLSKLSSEGGAAPRRRAGRWGKSARGRVRSAGRFAATRRSDAPMRRHRLSFSLATAFDARSRVFAPSSVVAPWWVIDVCGGLLCGGRRRRHPPPLLIAQPKQVLAHDPDPPTNQGSQESGFGVSATN
jgi:hypothetical protein